MEIEMDGRSIKSQADFHAVFADKFRLSPLYGRNRDALWDVLTTDIPRPATLIWRYSENSRLQMGNDFFALVEVLRRVEAQDREWGLPDGERFVLKLS